MGWWNGRMLQQRKSDGSLTSVRKMKTKRKEKNLDDMKLALILMNRKLWTIYNETVYRNYHFDSGFVQVIHVGFFFFFNHRVFWTRFLIFVGIWHFNRSQNIRTDLNGFVF